MVTLNWGKSLTSQSSVYAIVSRGVENTVLVMVLVTLIATPLAIFFGVVSALRSEGVIDHVISVFVLVLVALPAFVIAVSLIFLLATTVFQVFPADVDRRPDAVDVLPDEHPRSCPWRRSRWPSSPTHCAWSERA